MNIEVTRILGDGSIRHARVEPEERPDAARWRELLSRANRISRRPTARIRGGRSIRSVTVSTRSRSRNAVWWDRCDLVAAVLAEGGEAD